VGSTLVPDAFDLALDFDFDTGWLTQPVLNYALAAPPVAVSRVG
jgi:hypothetical protein